MYDIERDPILADQSPRTLARRIEEVLSTLQRHEGTACRACAAPLCGHQTLMSLVLGRKDAPRCVACLAAENGRAPEDLAAGIVAYALSKDCLRVGWAWTSQREADRAGACRWDGQMAPAPAVSTVATAASAPEHAAVWDAGDMGCGDLVLELRVRLSAVLPGGVLKVTARDPGAPQDMPAWCRLTGNLLVSSNHPEYWIRRKEG